MRYPCTLVLTRQPVKEAARLPGFSHLVWPTKNWSSSDWLMGLASTSDTGLSGAEKPLDVPLFGLTHSGETVPCTGVPRS